MEKIIYKIHGKYAGDYYGYRDGLGKVCPCNYPSQAVKGVRAAAGDTVRVKHLGYKPERFQETTFQVY